MARRHSVHGRRKRQSGQAARRHDRYHPAPRSRGAARRNHDRIRTLHEITAAASSSLELNVVLEALMAKIVDLLPYAAVQIWLKTSTPGNWNGRHV